MYGLKASPPSANQSFWVGACSFLIHYGFQKVLVNYYVYPKPSMNYAVFYV